MSGWLTKLLVALAPTLLNWASSKLAELFTAASDNISTRVEENKKEKRKKKRNELERKLELAKERKDKDEIKRLSVALHLLDSEL